MATLSHEAFRRVVEKFGGVDEYYTEMINAPTLLQKGPYEKYYLLNGPAPEKIVWQLTSKDAESFARAVPILAQLGGIGIDINMGCSAPEIVRSGAGLAWMLKSERETLLMIEGVRKAVDKTNMRLSVKMRLGADNFSPQNFFAFCGRLADCGIEQIVLHPRTQKEKLIRPPRRHFVQELAELLKPRGVSVIYNGNVKDGASAEAALKECPDAAGIMISRAAVQKPWIFREIRDFLVSTGRANAVSVTNAAGSGAFLESQLLSTGRANAALATDAAAASENVGRIDLLQLGLDYIENLQVYQPPEFFKSRMQRFFAYYCDNFSFGHYIKTKMLVCSTPAEAEKTFRSYFNEVPDDRFMKIAKAPDAEI